LQLHRALIATTAVCLAPISALANVQLNGVDMNGVDMNGVDMNGVDMNGVDMNGVDMNGVDMNGISLDGLSLEGTALTGTLASATSTCSHSPLLPGGPLVSGCNPCVSLVVAASPRCAGAVWDAACVAVAAQVCKVGPANLIGSIFTANTTGGTVKLRLDGVRVAPNPNPVWAMAPNGTMIDVGKNINADVLLYSFSHLVKRTRFTPEKWLPLCNSTDRDGLFNMAIPVKGTWNSCPNDPAKLTPGCGGKVSNDGFTLACTDKGAIAKCVERLEYKPWLSVKEVDHRDASWHWQSLEPYHEACVRMLRADYCGDGLSHTMDGTQIDAWDNTNTQQQTAEAWSFEAEWGPSGAVCISETRYNSQSFNQSLNANPPSNANPITIGEYVVQHCGDKFGITSFLNAPGAISPPDCGSVPRLQPSSETPTSPNNYPHTSFIDDRAQTLQ
jgi:hypothetical protein